MPLLVRLVSVFAMLLLLVGVVCAEEAKRPLSAGEIEKLLGAGVSQSRVAELVGQRGVSFEATPAVMQQIKAAGAMDQVLAAVDRASLEAERRKLDAERKKMDEERKAGDAATKKAAAEGKKKADTERAAPKSDTTTSAPAPAKKAAQNKGGGQMVSVPGGPFFMGCNDLVDTECTDDEKPGRTVDVAAFRIDKMEVTVASYAHCVDAGVCNGEGLSSLNAKYCNWQHADRENHPINCVTWNEAITYCTWAGKRLPTEIEWEKAARGIDRRKYPWGNFGYSAGRLVANIADESLKTEFPSATIVPKYDDGHAITAPVGSFPAGASPTGALDMIGNVQEFTADARGDSCIARGGDWINNPAFARVSARSRVLSANRALIRGFRCAQ